MVPVAGTPEIITRTTILMVDTATETMATLQGRMVMGIIKGWDEARKCSVANASAVLCRQSS